MKKPIITISREIGSGGLTIARILSEKLNIKLYDKEIISIAAKESGLNKDFFEKTDEKESYNFFQRTLNSIFASNENCINNENLFNIQGETIINLASKESCIFVGRCADYILRDRDNVLKIFLSAPIKEREINIVENLNISPDEAIKLIEKTDKKRSSYYNFYSNKTWGKASSYDLCINTSLVGIEKTADIILQIFKEKFDY